MRKSEEQCSLAGRFRDQQGDLRLEQDGEGKNGRSGEQINEVTEDRLYKDRLWRPLTDFCCYSE